MMNQINGRDWIAKLKLEELGLAINRNADRGSGVWRTQRKKADSMIYYMQCMGFEI